MTMLACDDHASLVGHQEVKTDKFCPISRADFCPSCVGTYMRADTPQSKRPQKGRGVAEASPQSGHANTIAAARTWLHARRASAEIRRLPQRIDGCRARPAGTSARKALR